MLDHHNCYVQNFKSAMNKISYEFKVVILADKTPHGEYERNFNASAKDEVTLIMEDDGYHFELRQRNPITVIPQTKKISATQFYAYRVMQSISDFNILLKSKVLFHQFIVDMYAKIESKRLLYIRLNKRTLRVKHHVHLRDVVMNDGNVANIGQLIFLPSSFTGSPRHMHERTQDAMTYANNRLNVFRFREQT
ncbi:hypothetical protein AVEN_37070-1 [Araneus ventricosus]|uniref:Helitron helicase-like domain-containing protein n=1 Tax=Araneus ventricosus TaxID=182803 RepID=A0A4Y2QA85_ARAVE|nr:hypothetical protein AVEN_37070-1 [Araneus ventricosus]